MSLKLELTCRICKLVLKDPVSFPCHCVVCGEHVHDGSVKNGIIKCLKCDEDFDVPENGFRSNDMATNILAKELHLSEEEKTIKNSIHEMIKKLEQLQYELKQKHTDLDRLNFDHFSEIRRKIDIQREELKAKIDEIGLKMIEQSKEIEKAYKSKMDKLLSDTNQINVQQSRQILAYEYRKPNLLIKDVQCLQAEHDLNIKETHSRIADLNSLSNEIKSFEFKASQELCEDSFGSLKQKNKLIACIDHNTIRICNSDTKAIVATLEGHSQSITCLENIDESRFASGSSDRTIKIWDAKTYFCLKTLTGHKHEIKCITSLNSNTLASGSYSVINIWNLNSGVCIKTINDYSLKQVWVNGLTFLPNGNLVSSSKERNGHGVGFINIYVWDLESGICIKTIQENSGQTIDELENDMYNDTIRYGRNNELDQFVHCLLVLKNGHLASSSIDNSIKILDVNSGECIKILKGHSSHVTRLQVLENGELISCSADETIKVWDLNKGICIKTLTGYASLVVLFLMDH